MTSRRKLLMVAAVVAVALSLASVADAKGFRRYLR
ncbi:septum formation initiator family protein, partial [Corallococcus sp. AB049A]